MVKGQNYHSSKLDGTHWNANRVFLLLCEKRRTIYTSNYSMSCVMTDQFATSHSPHIFINSCQRFSFTL